MAMAGAKLNSKQAYGLLLVAGLTAAAYAQGPAVVPNPLSVTPGAGTVEIRTGAVVSYPAGDASAQFDAEHLVELLAKTAGLPLKSEAGHDAKALIVLKRDASVTAAEGYTVEVGDGHVVVTASKDAGLYYGTVTVWQLLTAGGAKDHVAGHALTLPAETIEDRPELPWRGIMLDSARHLQPIGAIRELIEAMSLEKLNTLHWHLTDDQGWRLEIKKYPKLTSVGGFRELASQEGETDPKTGKPYPRYGGFYTQDEVRALVKFAAQRGVTIVPEIEMPGHASAPLAAYPEFGVGGATPLSAPANHYGIFPSLYGVNDKTFGFLEDVLTEVMALFPGPFIHVGGDEAIKDQWKASPEIQATMKRLGIKDEDALQSYFIKRIDTFITAHGKRTLGWDEILQGGLAPGAAVMSWHGVKGGIDAAKQGHDAVLTPVRPLYFNYRQSDAAGEAAGRFAINSLADVYNFDPLPSTLTAEEHEHILGVQANVWTEYLLTPDRIQWMIFPRTAALAEIGWSAPSRRDFSDFEKRLTVELTRYRALGLSFDPAVFAVRSMETIAAGSESVQVALSNQTEFGKIHYTTDGSAVTAASKTYDTPFAVTMPARVRAATFGEGEVVGSELDRKLDDVSVRRRYSQELRLCTNNAIAMEQDPPHGDRPAMLADYQHPCWVYRQAVMDGVRGISLQMGTIPYWFAETRKAPEPGPAATPHGEIEVHADSCTGKLLTTVPFPAITRMATLVTLHAELPAMTGVHDLCLKEARPDLTPLWLVNWAQTDLNEGKTK